jgi:tRNA-Thr(GGU) m(6)t(6)A37 methyltransferase TsaA
MARQKLVKSRSSGAKNKPTKLPAQRAVLRPVGTIRSTLKTRSAAPKQGSEGAPDAWLEIEAFALEALDGIQPGDELIVMTWFHQSRRDVLKVHPRSDPNNALTGVFATRSPDRPNPIGLHPVTVREIAGRRLRIGPIEAIDGTPVIDIKPELACRKA